MRLKKLLFGIIGTAALIASSVLCACDPAVGKQEECDRGGNGGAIVSAGESAGIELTSVKLMADEYEENGVSALAETAYTLTVTPIPSNAEDKYTWTLSDTTNLSISVSTDTKSATLSCLSAFGTAATLTVRSQANAEVYATKTIDYLKRVTDLTVSVTPGSVKFSTSSTVHTVTVTPTYGTGTVTPESASVSGVLKSNLGADASVTSGSTIYSVKKCDLTFTGTSFSLTTPYATFTNGYNEREDITLTGYRFAGYRFMAIAPTDQLKDLYNNDFILKATGTTSDGTLTVTYTYGYGGETYGTAEKSIGVAFNVTSMSTLATSVSISGGEIVF